MIPPDKIDGPTLRALRLAQGIPVRQIAALAKVSHGHLSKVESGEASDRKVTPRILLAYSRATGYDLKLGIPDEAMESRISAGQKNLSAGARAAHVAELAAVAYGQPPLQELSLVLDRVRRRLTIDVAEEDGTYVEQIATFLNDASGTAGRLAEVVLGLIDSHLDDRNANPRLQRACMTLALRAAEAADADDRFAAGRALRTIALRLAVILDDPDLRALALLRSAQQFARRGWPEAAELLRLASGDDRVSEDVGVELKRMRRVVDALPEQATGR